MNKTTTKDLLLVLDSPLNRFTERLLGQFLSAASISRERVQIQVGYRGPSHSTRVIMPLGDFPLLQVSPELPAPPRWADSEGKADKSRIQAWRGSVWPLSNPMTSLEFYKAAIRQLYFPVVLPTLPLYDLHKRYEWHPYALRDFKAAHSILDGKWQVPKECEWHDSPQHGFAKYVDSLENIEHLVAVDTELDPITLALVSEEDVWLFDSDGIVAHKDTLKRLFASSAILKLAHNAEFDWTFISQRLGIPVEFPYADTGGFAHILDPSQAKSLSPGMSTRFTTYPYHKWLSSLDIKVYCGLDTAVCYDAYWTQIEELSKRSLLKVADHDMRLLRHLLEMQWRGVRIDRSARQDSEDSLTTQLRRRESRLCHGC